MFGRTCKLVATGAAAAVALLAAAPAGAVDAGATRQVASVNALEAAVLTDVNALRRRHGLGTLKMSARLVRAADAHSQAMAERGFFAHESADGAAFWRRVKRYYPQSKYRFWSVGENLLWASPEITSAEALQLWMNSPAHRKNLLTKRWREIGLSAVHVGSAPGIFGGLEVTIVTADFGVRR